MTIIVLFVPANLVLPPSPAHEAQSAPFGPRHITNLEQICVLTPGTFFDTHYLLMRLAIIFNSWIELKMPTLKTRPARV